MNLSDILGGGRPGETIKLKKLYDLYAQDTMGTGQDPMDWPTWLDTQGYTLGQDNLVQPKSIRQNPTLRQLNY